MIIIIFVVVSLSGLATLSARSFLASTTTAAADEEVEEENSAQAADGI